MAVVLPRYGEGIAGGAESLGRGVAEESVRQGWQSEIWTTCVRDHYSWENEYPVGVEFNDGLTIRRFPVQLYDLERNLQLEIWLDTRGKLSLKQQYAWLEGGAHSPGLYAHIANHASDFDIVLVLPYAMPMMQSAAWAAPERVLMWPCLHDEPYAYMEPLRLLLENVWGVAFNSPEEGELTTQHLGIRLKRHAVLGVGVPAPEPPISHLSASSPYLLYIGRLEEGKNVPLLYDYVQRYVEDGRGYDFGGNLQLIVGGSGPRHPPAHPAFDYRGFVSESEKMRLCASALAVCQPSLNESFSIIIMESWLAGRPVLVHRDCPVTQGHVQRSKGGLWFSTYEMFAETVDWLLTNPSQASQMGHNGQKYVQENYSWKMVVKRLEKLLERGATDE